MKRDEGSRHDTSNDGDAGDAKGTWVFKSRFRNLEVTLAEGLRRFVSVFTVRRFTRCFFRDGGRQKQTLDEGQEGREEEGRGSLP